MFVVYRGKYLYGLRCPYTTDTAVIIMQIGLYYFVSETAYNRNWNTYFVSQYISNCYIMIMLGHICLWPETNALHKWGRESVVSCLTYRSDLVISDFHFFVAPKNKLRATRFSYIQELKDAIRVVGQRVLHTILLKFFLSRSKCKDSANELSLTETILNSAVLCTQVQCT